MSEQELEQELSPEEVRDIALECYADPVRFCEFFLPHLFPAPIPWIHRGLLAILTGRVDFLWKYGEVDKIERNFIWKDEHEEEHRLFEVDWESEKIKLVLRRFTLLEMPRGSSKTTIAGIAIPLYKICYQVVPFIAYVSEAAPHAKMQLHNVQRELIDNRRLMAVFGDMKPKLRDDEKWSGDFFETKTGMAFVARGRGGQIRGLLHRGHRPSQIIVDDVEDKESVETEPQRQKTRVWAYGDLIPALPEMDPSATIVALGTMLHNQCLMETWAKDPDWNVVKFGALDRDGEPIWARWMDKEKLARRKLSFAAVGQLHTYYLEYFNQAIAPEIQPFRQEYFKYNPETSDITHSALYVDPAISAKRTADKTAMAVVGITERGILRVLDMVMKRGMSEREKIDTYFVLDKKWKCNKHGIESTAYQAALVHTMREEMFRKHQYHEIDPVTHKTKKTVRVMGILQPRFAAGYIEFRVRFPELETELLDFRSDTDDQADDGPDALAGCVSLLDPYAAQAAGDTDLSEDEYEPLEEALGGEWRYH